MPRLTIDRFHGEIPQMAADLLPIGYAQKATNCNMESQALSCFNANALVQSGNASVQSAYWTGNTWRMLDQTENIIDAPVANDRRYAGAYAPQGQAARDAPSIIQFAGTAAADTVRNLALPAPTTAIQTVTVDTTNRENDANGLPDPPLQQSIAVYTFVTDLNEESRPSPPSAAFQRQPGTDNMTITLPSVPTDAQTRGVNRQRVYVSETIFGQTQFQLLAETTRIETSVAIAGNKQSEGLLPSTDYDSLPDAYRGFVTMPNGIVVAHRSNASPGKELRFSEQYRPHAWPIAYERLVDDDIVGLAMFGQTLCVCTTGRPFLATGLTPSTITLRKIDSIAPCIERQSIIDLGYSAAYASPRGLILISDDNVSVVTSRLLAQDQWNKLSQNIRAGQWDARYIWSHDDDGGRATHMLDLSGEQPYIQRLDIAARSWIYREDELTAYYVNENGNLYRFNDPTQPHIPFDWTSGIFQSPTPISFGAFLVQGTSFNQETVDATFEIIADGNIIATGTQINEVTRIPQGRYRNWSMRLRARATIQKVTLVSGIEEFAA